VINFVCVKNAPIELTLRTRISVIFPFKNSLRSYSW